MLYFLFDKIQDTGTRVDNTFFQVLKLIFDWWQQMCSCVVFNRKYISIPHEVLKGTRNDFHNRNIFRTVFVITKKSWPSATCPRDINSHRQNLNFDIYHKVWHSFNYSTNSISNPAFWSFITVVNISLCDIATLTAVNPIKRLMDVPDVTPSDYSKLEFPEVIGSFCENMLFISCRNMQIIWLLIWSFTFRTSHVISITSLYIKVWYWPTFR